MKEPSKGTFFDQESIQDLAKENVNIFLIDRCETGLTSLEKAILKRFFSRREPISELAERFKLEPQALVSILKKSLDQLKLTEKRVREKQSSESESFIPAVRRCHFCGRKLKDQNSDVYCRPCLRDEKSTYQNFKRTKHSEDVNQ